VYNEINTEIPLLKQSQRPDITKSDITKSVTTKSNMTKSDITKSDITKSRLLSAAGGININRNYVSYPLRDKY